MKARLDQLLTDRGLAQSREKARALILAGAVRVDGQKADKPGHSYSVECRVEVAERMPYVSRGGFKLAGALDHFGLDVTGKTCLDVGASTGGFTQVLLALFWLTMAISLQQSRPAPGSTPSSATP